MSAEAHRHPLLNSVADRTWIQYALCRGRGELFFAAFGEREEQREIREARALALCHQCPVRLACRDSARRNHETGIWGGETDEDRARAGFATRGLASRRVLAARRGGPDSPGGGDDAA